MVEPSPAGNVLRMLGRINLIGLGEILGFCNNYMGCLMEFYETLSIRRLGSVAGPVIQATGRSKFEDGLGSGDFVSGYSYHKSVRTRLSDQTKQTKFQS
jgi:hypothetical protein